MKKRISCLIVLAVVLLFSLAVTASANHVSNIDITVTVFDDGSAGITQVWDGKFNEGTENYVPINTDSIEISNFSVSDEKGEYSFVENWNIDASFGEKSRKCGINQTGEGIELCFGISDYGTKKYTFSYTVHGFIKSYTDYDGTNFMLVNSGMNTFPTDARINISLANGTALNDQNAAVWAFGYYGQSVFTDDGKVTAYTEAELDGSDSMIVMLRLNKGIITPAYNVDGAFENVKNEAMEGSDYYTYEETPLSRFIEILIYVGIIAVIVIVVLIIRSVIKRRKAIRKFYKEVQYFRDVPNRGDLCVSNYLSHIFDLAGDKSLIIGATLLSMMNKHFIEPQTDESVGFFGRVKTEVNLRLMGEPDTELEARLYRIIKGAAGADGILQENELKNYSYKNPKLLEDFIDDAHNKGADRFEDEGGFVNGRGNKISDLSEEGKKELAEIMGLKKYLEEFSLIDERQIKEIAIWKSYLVYATLFGIADTVIEQFKNVYPDIMPEIETYNRNVVIVNSYYHTMYSSYTRAMEAKRSSGGGGFSSIGGGGGFSGGGVGGGSR